MTLSAIMKLALRQLDEAAEDISEFDELFRSYANMGYMIALRLFLRPREHMELKTDEKGSAEISVLPVSRVVEVRDGAGNDLPFAISADGTKIELGRGGLTVYALCEVEYPPMTSDTDEPRLPEFVQPALADYICYRHLSSGNLNKQSRAEFFRQSFYQQMRAMMHQGAYSVTGLRHLYEATRADRY